MEIALQLDDQSHAAHGLAGQIDHQVVLLFPFQPMRIDLDRPPLAAGERVVPANRPAVDLKNVESLGHVEFQLETPARWIV